MTIILEVAEQIVKIAVWIQEISCFTTACKENIKIARKTDIPLEEALEEWHKNKEMATNDAGAVCVNNIASFILKSVECVFRVPFQNNIVGIRILTWYRSFPIYGLR